MRRKASKGSRLANTAEKDWHSWLKVHGCVWCGVPGPSIVDHCRGSAFRFNKVLIGHRFCLPQCVRCDAQKTIHGKRQGNEALQWSFLNEEYFNDTGQRASPEEEFAIKLGIHKSFL